MTSYKFHIQGMSDAFFIRFHFSLRSNSLVELNNKTFFEFPDLYPEHEMRYCDCFGRSIFSSIEHLRQELWRFLCRYGQSQGLFPKGTIKLVITPQFSFYVSNFLANDSMECTSLEARDMERRVQYHLMYRMVQTKESFQLFNFDSEAKLASFQKLIGEMSIVGVRMKRPRLSTEFEVSMNSLLNMTSQIELYLSSMKLKLKCHAFGHVIGNDRPSNEWLALQLTQRLPQGTIQEQARSIRINSRFDHNNGLR